jgi:LemA protein
MVAVYIATGILILYVISLFNGLIRAKNRVDYAVGGIEAILKKRLDMIPNLVETVKKYMNYESGILNNIVLHRNQPVVNPVNTDTLTTKALNSVLMRAEDYPHLKSNPSFFQLQLAITETEEQLSAARRTYNANVLLFNNRIKTIPSNLVAGILKYHALPMHAMEIHKSKS